MTEVDLREASSAIDVFGYPLVSLWMVMLFMVGSSVL